MSLDFGLLLVPIFYLIPALVLYVIIRFGVKHGMRAYYAEAARRSSPPEGPATGAPGRPTP